MASFQAEVGSDSGLVRKWHHRGRSRSVPERGARGTVYGTGDMVPMQSNDNLASLDLVRSHKGPTLKPSIPVQRTSAYTKKRRYGTEQQPHADLAWLLDAPPTPASSQNPSSQITLRNVMREASRTAVTNVEPLLLSWFSVMLGVVSYSLLNAKVKAMSQDECLVMSWAYMGAVFCTTIVCLLAMCCKSDQTWHEVSAADTLPPKTRMTLIALSTLLAGASSSMWFIAVRYVPRSSGAFFFTIHTVVVLVIKDFMGDGSSTGEKIGVATTLLGAGCYGITDYVGEDKKSVSADDLARGITLAILSGGVFALAMVVAKFVRTHPGMTHTLPFLLVMYTCMSFFCVVITATVFPDQDAMAFTTNEDSGLLGWTHILPKWVLLTVYLTVAVASVLYSLRVLPTVVVSAIITLQPPLTFVSDLVTQDAESSVPLPTQSVGALCVIAGCVCICRSATHSLNAYLGTSYGPQTEPSSQGRQAKPFPQSTHLPLTRELRVPHINEDEPTPRRS